MADVPGNSTQEENAATHGEAPSVGGGMLLDQAALDALFDAARKEEAEGTSPAPDAAPEKVETLDEGDIDSLLKDYDIDRPLVDRDIDGVLGDAKSPEAAAEESVSASAAGVLSQDMIDAPTPSPEPKESSAGVLSQGDLDALLAQAQAESDEKRVARQNAIEHVLEGPARPVLEEPARAVPEEPAAVVPVSRERAPGIIARYVAANVLKTFASLSIGVVASLGTYNYLYTHPQQEAGFPVATVPAPGALQTVPLEAPPEGQDAAGKTAATPGVETQPDAPALPTPEGARTEYDEIASTYPVVLENRKAGEMRVLRQRIDDFINASPSHPKAVDVLQWKAHLYELEHKPYAAREVYRKILTAYSDSADLDSALLGAAEAANEVGHPQEAIRCVERLLADFPESKHLAEAQVALADAYLATGKTGDAGALYERVAGGEPGSPGQADALVGLARVAMEHARYDEAVKLLETRLALAAQSEGVDKVNLLLAKAYRGAGRLAEARETLNGMLTSFPESDVLPSTLVELSRVLEDMGSREEALQVARQATEQYPKDAQVLRNEGSILALNGKYREAADLLMSAARAGLSDPQVLLEAARNYRDGEAFAESRKTYERMVTRFPRSSQAFIGRLEWTEALYRDGMQKEGIRRLEELAASVQAGPQRLPVLISLAKMYQELGLQERAAELAKEIATVSTEPEVLAQAAAVLIDGGARDEGVALAARADLSKLSDKSAYGLLAKQGGALISSDPRKAATLLEHAYENYAAERTPDLTVRLAQAHLAANDAPRAEALLSRLEEEARLNPVDAPQLRTVAVAVGDYLYDKKEFARAAESYRRSLLGDDGKSPEYAWAKYQVANVLLQTGDFAGSAQLYLQVSKANSPWSREAAVKAEYARAEQRLREQPATAKPSSSTSAGPGVASS